jgi:hypothetical protein
MRRRSELIAESHFGNMAHSYLSLVTTIMLFAFSDRPLPQFQSSDPPAVTSVLHLNAR